MTSPERLRTEHDVTALAALDTIDLLADRITELLADGRRMAICQRYLTQEHVVLTAGCTLAEEPRRWKGAKAAGFSFQISPGLRAVTFAAWASDGNRTENEAWARYHDSAEGRRNLTEITISGGLPGRGPGRSDLLSITDWNSNGVGRKTVVAFDTGTGITARNLQLDQLRAAIAAAEAEPTDTNRAYADLCGLAIAVDVTTPPRS